MHAAMTDARRELETIRSLMERSRWYRHLPPQAPFFGGLLALAGGYYTHTQLGADTGWEVLPRLGIVWGSIFLVALGTQILWSWLAAKKAGSALWSPLAAEIVHALWPPFLVGVALTAVFVRNDVPGLIPSLWMLCYGIAGVSAGAYARPAVRVLGVGFLLAGCINLALSLPPGVALGAAFGGFHVIYGLALLRRPLAE